MAKLWLSFQNGIDSYLSDSVIPCFYESFIKGLVDSGNEVMVCHAYGMPYKNRPEESAIIQSSLKRFSPDLVIAFNNYGPDYSQYCDCPIMVYEVDSPLYYEHKDCIRSAPGRYVFCVNQIESLKILIDDFGVPEFNIKWVPFFTEVRAESREKDIDISFVGSRFAGTSLHWHNFRKTARSAEELILYRAAAKELAENPFVSFELFLDRYKRLRLTADDIVFMIASLSAEKRVKILSAVADLGLQLFGTEDWLHARDSDIDLCLAYNPQKIYSLRQNQDLYNRSKICLNVNHLQAVSGFSWRVCDIMASSGCLVTEKTENLIKFFPVIPIPVFTNRFDCREQVLRVLESPALQEDVSAACQEAIESKFRFRHVLPILEEVSGVGLSSGTGAGKLSFVKHAMTSDVRFGSKKKKKTTLALNCMKMAMCQIPGMGRLFNQEKLLNRIAGFAPAPKAR